MHFIAHLFFKPIFSFFLALGGISRWYFFRIINRLYDTQYPNELDYYLSNMKDKELSDELGLTKREKNFIVSLLIFILFIVLAEKLEK